MGLYTTTSPGHHAVLTATQLLVGNMAKWHTYQKKKKKVTNISQKRMVCKQSNLAMQFSIAEAKGRGGIGDLGYPLLQTH